MNSIINIDIPLQMISCTDTNGNITPLRFRFRDKNNEVISIIVEKVTSREQDKNKAIIKFSCQSEIYGVIKSYEISYNLCLHQWKMIRIY